MRFTFRPLHPHFVAEVTGPRLQDVHDPADLARLWSLYARRKG